jgi:putative CocE/NonD family hydrolase
MKFRYFSVFALLTTLAFCSVTPVTAQQPEATPTELARYIKKNYDKREVMIPMRDGVKLFTAIYEPKDKGKYPILLNRTPYTVRPYGENEYRESLGPDRLFAKEGYIFVSQDVRGRWMSEGEFENVRPDIVNTKPTDIDESTDTYDTIDWLVKNVANNNGRVGIYGISYPGFYASAGSIDSHPALKACSPQAPVSDWFHGDDMHHNGALFLAQNYSFFRGFGQPRPVPTSDENYMKKWTGNPTPDGYNYFLNEGGLASVAESYREGLGIRIKFWDQMMAHPNYDQFWKDRNILPKLKGIKCATMTVGGWYDNEDLYGALKTYQYTEAQNPGIFNVLVVGPWDHGGWSRNDGDWLGTAYFTQKTGEYYRENLELQFFNHFLKDKGDISKLKEVNLFDTGAHIWRSFDTYNPPGTVKTPIYLGGDGKLSFSKPGPSARGFDEYVSDPMNPVPYTQKTTFNYPRDFMTEDQRFAAARPDVLVYQTDILDSDITVAGDIEPRLFISSSGTDSDFVVKLIDVFPDDYQYPETGKKILENGEPERIKPPEGYFSSIFKPGGYQMLLRGEPMPARFRNSFEKPAPLVPGQASKLNFVMPGVTHTFKKGHRIMVQIQSTWFPLVARNPQKYMTNYKLGGDTDFQKATQRVYRGGANASSVVLPILK